MRISTIMALVAATHAALGACFVWSVPESFDPVPAPADLRVFSGTATSVYTSTILYTRSHATFQLRQSNGASIEFSYKPMYKGFYYFAENLKDGLPVEITTGPGGVHDIWALKLDSRSVMTLTEAREARMTDGKWGLALSFGFLAAGLWSAHKARDFRRRGV